LNFIHAKEKRGSRNKGNGNRNRGDGNKRSEGKQKGNKRKTGFSLARAAFLMLYCLLD
jgi:hypothetical protein